MTVVTTRATSPVFAATILTAVLTLSGAHPARANSTPRARQGTAWAKTCHPTVRHLVSAAKPGRARAHTPRQHQTSPQAAGRTQPPHTPAQAQADQPRSLHAGQHSQPPAQVSAATHTTPATHAEPAPAKSPTNCSQPPPTNQPQPDPHHQPPTNHLRLNEPPREGVPEASSSTPPATTTLFGSPEAAAEWARTQTVWPELDLSDGYSVAIVLGSEFNANQAAWEAWEGGEFPDAPPVHNYARDLGLVREEPAVPKHRKLLDRLKWR
jgi:hypothetical protein